MHTEIKEDGHLWTVSQRDGDIAHFATEEDAMRHAFAHDGPHLATIRPPLESAPVEMWQPHGDPLPIVPVSPECARRSAAGKP